MCLILILMRSATKFKTHTHSYSLWSDARSYSHFAHTHVQLALHIHTTSVFLAPKTGAKFEILKFSILAHTLAHSRMFEFYCSYSLLWAPNFGWQPHTHSREQRNLHGLLILTLVSTKMCLACSYSLPMRSDMSWVEHEFSWVTHE